MNENLILLGRITKTHGYSGNLIFVLNTFKTEVISDYSWVFIERHGEKVPYKVVEWREIDNSKIMVSLKDIDSEDIAKSFIGSDFYLPDTTINLAPSEEFLLAGIEGWKLYQSGNYLGEVIEIIDNKAQTLLKVLGEENEFYIPLVDDFLEEFLPDENKIIVNIPDGLIDL